MAKHQDLTTEAAAGFRGEVNLHLATSACWFAHRLGEYFQRTGRPEPHGVRMGRGYQVHASDMLFAFDSHNSITRVK